jgi:cytochrome c5
MTVNPIPGRTLRPKRKVLGVVADAFVALFATGALAAASEENDRQKSLESCLQQVKAADQEIDPVDRSETANLLSDAVDMCHAGHAAAARKLIEIAQDLDELRRSVQTE